MLAAALIVNRDDKKAAQTDAPFSADRAILTVKLILAR